MRSTPSLPSLPGPLWPGVVAPDRLLSMDQIQVKCLLMQILIGENSVTSTWNASISVWRYNRLSTRQVKGRFFQYSNPPLRQELLNAQIVDDVLTPICTPYDHHTAVLASFLRSLSANTIIFGDNLPSTVFFHVQLTSDHSNCKLMIATHQQSNRVDVDRCHAFWGPPLSSQLILNV